jgi:hypothetical protein
MNADIRSKSAAGSGSAVNAPIAGGGVATVGVRIAS